MLQQLTINDLDLVKSIKKIRLLIFDFDGVFTDNSVYISENGTEYVRCTREDGLGLEKIRKTCIKVMVLSTEKNPVVIKRCEKLKIQCINGIADKGKKIKEIIKKENLGFSQVCYVGNDINDINCLKAVALPIVVSDAHHDVLIYAKYVTSKKGGYGAVREICDLFDLIVNPGE